MQTLKHIFSTALIVAFFLAGNSCKKKNNNIMDNTGTPSLSLSAQQTSISTNGTTKITASVSNLQSCCTMTYTWSANAGSISENGNEATFTAPTNSAQCTVTCSAKDNCGKISQSKSIVISVQ